MYAPARGLPVSAAGRSASNRNALLNRTAEPHLTACAAAKPDVPPSQRRDAEANAGLSRSQPTAQQFPRDARPASGQGRDPRQRTSRRDTAVEDRPRDGRAGNRLLEDSPPRAQGGPGRRQDSDGSSERGPRSHRGGRDKPKVLRTTSQQEMQRRQGCCYGCGAKLQITVPLGPGYVDKAKYELKQKHKQLDKVLCARCSELCNGAMIPAVEDFTQKLQAKAMLETHTATQESLEMLGKALITPDQLRTQLMEVAAKKAVVVLLVDLTDTSGTLMAKVRDMVGRNPIILIGTKMDLLPEGAHPKAVADWLQEAAARKGLNVVSCHLVSSHTAEGMSAATGKICRERKGRDVYVVGAANVGKSAFVRAMLKDMAKFDSGNFDPAALANGRYLPVESPMPGTTLGVIPLKAFESGGTLFDTPGVHLHHRVQHMLSPDELKLLHPRKRLVALLPPSPLDLTQQQLQEQESSQQQQSQATHTAADGADSGGSASQGQGGGGGGGGGDGAVWEENLPEGWDTGRRGVGRRRGKGDSKASVSLPAEVRGRYTWSDLVQVDVLTAGPGTALAFYGPTTMRVDANPLPDAHTNTPPATHTATTSGRTRESEGVGVSGGGDASSGASGGGSKVLNCAGSVKARGGLVPYLLTVRSDGSYRPLTDIAVSGVPGWITVWSPNTRKDVKLRVWVPRGVEVFLRPPLPCDSPLQDSAYSNEEALDLTEVDLSSLAADYDTYEGQQGQQGRGGKANLNDAAWWEAAIQELQAFDDGEGEEEGADTDTDNTQDETASPRRRARLPGLGRAARGADRGGGGERIVMQATVEDILRRPRLDKVISDIGLDDLDAQTDEGENAYDDNARASTSDGVPVAVSRADRMLARQARRRARRDADSQQGDGDDEPGGDEEGDGDGEGEVEEVRVFGAGRPRGRRVGLLGRRGLRRASSAAQQDEED